MIILFIARYLVNKVLKTRNEEKNPLLLKQQASNGQFTSTTQT